MVHNEGESRDVVLKFSATTTDAKPETSAANSGVSPLTYVGFGVAGAGVIVGSVFGVMAMGKRSGPPDGEDTYKSTAMISTVSFVVAGAGATIGLIGLLTGGSSEHTSGSAPSWHPWVSVGSAGVSGHF